MDFFWASNFQAQNHTAIFGISFMFNSILMYCCTLLIFCVASQECTSSPLIAPSKCSIHNSKINPNVLVDNGGHKEVPEVKREICCKNWIPMIGQDLVGRLCGERGQPWPKILPEDADSQQTWVPWFIMSFLGFFGSRVAAVGFSRGQACRVFWLEGNKGW